MSKPERPRGLVEIGAVDEHRDAVFRVEQPLGGSDAHIDELRNG